MMNEKQFGRKGSRPKFKVFSWHFLGGTEKKHKITQSG
jgi:hypothetical protein